LELLCKRCGTVIEISGAVHDPQRRVVCPGCKTQYRLRPKKPSATSSAPFDATRSPTTPVAAAPSQGVATQTPTRHLSGSEAAVAGATASTVFAPGSLIAERYRVLRFLARGGMGEVYEVEDLELLDRLALKTILPRGLEAAGMVDRFKREIHLARKVTHPNVCRIFEFGQHRPAAGGEPVVFLTMELLHGETLAQQLRRRGAMRTDEARPLLTQMAAALEAAHRAGVVHRDLKSENVFLVPDGAGTRLVVTDFGIARGGGGNDRFAAQVTGGGSIGTPAYMAPEQVEGKTATPAADVYAFGVVAYEMLTGHLPFEAQDPITAAVKRLSEPPPPPRTYVPGLAAPWEAMILRSMARQPEDRYPSAAAAIADLDAVPAPETTHSTLPVAGTSAPAPAASGHTTPAGTGMERPASPTAGSRAGTAITGGTARSGPRPPTAPRPALTHAGSGDRQRKRRLGGLLVTVILLSAALWSFNAWRRADDGSRRLVTPRRSVAVLGFRNVSERDEDAWLATGLAEMLSTELAESASLRVVPGATVARMRKELAIAPSESLEPAVLASVRALLGCDFLASGSYITLPGPDGGNIRIELALRDAASGTVLDSANFNGPRSALFDLITDAGTDIRQRLGAEQPDEKRVNTLPTDPKAAQLYAQALERLRSSEPLVARDLLREAVRHEPDNALLHAALSSAWEALGYQQEARASAARSFQLAGKLDREDRLLVEGRYRETLGAWSAAVEAYRALWDYRPDNLEYGLRLAAAESADFRPQDALVTVAEMRRLPPPLDADPRIDLAQSAAYGTQSAFGEQLVAATAAAQKARRLGASLLLARAEIVRSSALRNLGRQPEAIQAAENALAGYRERNNPAGIAEALVNLANAQYESGDLEQAQALFTEARDHYREIGDRGGDAATLSSLALVLRRRGEHSRARALYREAAGIFREIGNRPAIANNLNNFATLLASEEKLEQARKMFEESRAIWVEIENKSGEGYALANISGVLRREGALGQSLRTARQALELRRAIGHPLGEVSSLAGIAAIELDRGELESAASDLEQASALAERLEARAVLARIRFSQGEIARLRGDLERAQTLHRQALETRRALGDTGAGTDSQIALARLRLDAGQPAAAALEARLAAEACRRQSRPGQAARAGSVLASALLADRHLVAARKVVERILPVAKPSELAKAHFEVRLVAARVRAASGDPAGARTMLDKIGAEVESAGYGALALAVRLEVAEVETRWGNAQRGHQLATEVARDAQAGGFELYHRRAAALTE